MLEEIFYFLSHPPGQVILAGAVTFGLAGVLRGLRTPWYAAHILLTIGFCWGIALIFGSARPTTSSAIKDVLLAHLFSINPLTFLLYWMDKRAAVKGAWRIPERVLHSFTLIGGSPAAWLAQRRLRHKNRKRDFQSVWWLILVFQLTALCWLFILT